MSRSPVPSPPSPTGKHSAVNVRALSSRPLRMAAAAASADRLFLKAFGAMSTCMGTAAYVEWLIYNIRRTAGEPCGKVGECAGHQSDTGFFCCPGNVRGDQAIFCVEQRVGDRWGLGRKDIDRCAGDAPAIECLCEVFFDNDGTSGCVEEE